MIVPKKRKIRLRQNTYLKTYRKFAVCKPLDSQEKRRAFDGEKVLYASNSENCFFEDGISADIYAKKLNIAPSADTSLDVKKFFSYGKKGAETLGYIKGYGIACFYDSSTKAFVTKNNDRYVEADVVDYFNQAGEKCVAFVYRSGVVLCDGGNLTKVHSGSTASRGCYAGERLFFIGQNYRVHYSAPLNAGDFQNSADESGYLDLPSTDGDIVDIKGYGGDVLVFMAHGVGKISARGLASDFRYEKLAYKGSRILARCAAVSADGVYFAAMDGIYLCDGREIKKVETKSPLEFVATGKIDNAVFRYGRMFINFYDGFSKSNKCYSLNTLTGDGAYMDFLPALSVASGELVSYLDGEFKCLMIGSNEGRLSANTFSGKSFFTIDDTDFGVAGQKTIESVLLSGFGFCTVTLGSNGVVWSETVDLSEEKELTAHLKGNTFSLSIELEKGGKISLLQLKIKGD